MSYGLRIPYSEQIWRRNVQSVDSQRLIMLAIAHAKLSKNLETLRTLRASRDFKRFANAIHSNLATIIEMKCNGAPPYTIEQYVPEGRDVLSELDESSEINRLKNLYLQYLATQMISLGFPDDSKLNALRERMAEIQRIGISGIREETIAENLEEAIIEDSILLWPSKFPSLNELFNGGIRSKRLYTIGGASGVGKSIMLLNLFENAIKNEVPSLMISLENTLNETKKRLISLWTRTPMFKISPKLLENDWFKTSLRDFEMYSAYGKIIEASSLTLKDIINLINNSDIRPQAVFLDYLNLVNHSPYRNRTEDLEDLTKSLRDFSVQADIALFSACQLNRTALASEEPDESTVGESYGIVRASDVFATIYYNKKRYIRNRKANSAFLNITKSRISRCKKIPITINASEMRIEEEIEEE